MKRPFPRYYRPDQLDDHNVYMTMQWWSVEQRLALYALHMEEAEAYRAMLTADDEYVAREH